MKTLCFLILGVILLGTSLYGHSFENRDAGLMVPPEQMQFFTLGYNQVVADTLWIRLLQDFETCGKQPSNTSSPQKFNVVEEETRKRVGRCENSWSFKMIDAITELDPLFREPYSSGAVILGIAVDDVAGATRIFEKAISRFPNDWSIQYTASYHFLYDVGDRRRAADLLISAGKNGAPYWVPILAARLYSKSGAARLGKAVIEDFIIKNPDQAENPHLKQRLLEIDRDLRIQDEQDSE